jgi:hypothetical protein
MTRDPISIVVLIVAFLAVGLPYSSRRLRASPESMYGTNTC